MSVQNGENQKEIEKLYDAGVSEEVRYHLAIASVL
jgi:hypothetical protein